MEREPTIAGLTVNLYWKGTECYSRFNSSTNLPIFQTSLLAKKELEYKNCLSLFQTCYDNLQNKKNSFWFIHFSIIWWTTLLTNSSYQPHKTYISWSILLLHQGGTRKPQAVFHFCHRGWTHFIWLVQTLIYSWKKFGKC